MSVTTEPSARTALPSNVSRALRRYPLAFAGAAFIVLMILTALLAHWLHTVDPIAMAPSRRLKPPSAAFWMGTDMFGRDIWSRVVYGSRTSLIVGASASVICVTIGLVIGLFSGYFRALDSVIMRFMDGLMSIPGILLAIALVAVSGTATVYTVVIAISVPEIPRIVRLVRAVVLTVRQEPYVEAAISLGTPVTKILARHIFPNTIPPLIVQASYVCASAMLTEAILSFLGAGTPPEMPSWGNMIAEGRIYFPIAPWIVIFPGIALALTILAVNVLGDGLRDRLDPRIARKM